VPVIPLRAAPVPFSTAAGQIFSGVVATFSSGSAQDQPSNFTAVINWGDGSSSAGTIGRGSSGGFTVSGTHVYNEGGIFSARIVISKQATGASIATTSTATVAPHPLNAIPVPAQFQEGQAVPVILADFSDPDPIAHDATFYSATISWGDGTTSSGTVSARAGGGFAVTGAHAFGGGSYTIQVSIQSQSTATAQAQETVSIADNPLEAVPAPNFTTQEGSTFTGTVACFSDADPRTLPASYYQATIDWGDGTTSPGTVVLSSSSLGRFAVQGEHVFAAGITPIHVAITAADGGIAATSPDTIATIIPAPVNPQGITINATEGTSFSGIIAYFFSTNLSAAAGAFHASIDWGDGPDPTKGTPTDDTIGVIDNYGAGELIITGHHRFPAGNFQTTVTLTESAAAAAGLPGASTTATTQVTSLDAPLTVAQSSSIQGRAGIPLTLTAGFMDADSVAQVSNFTVNVDWGDGTSSTGTISAGANGSFMVAAPHIYPTPGSFTVNLVIKDSGGSALSINTEATITGPSAQVSGTAIQATAGSPFNGSVSTFTTGDPTLGAGTFQATIDWGDSTTSIGAISASPAGGFVVTGQHTYTQGGDYVVGTTVTGPTGTPGSATSLAHVLYQLVGLTGTLTPASDSGLSKSDDITNVTSPRFSGTAAPNAIVSLFAQASGASQARLIGQGPSDPFGRWSIMANALADGSYTISASASTPSGHVVSPLAQLLPTAGHGPLIIDTIGARITATSFSPSAGQFSFTVDAGPGGIDPGLFADATAYSFTMQTLRGPVSVPISGLSETSEGTGAVTVSLTFNAGRRLRAGLYTLSVNLSGHTDQAGNPVVLGPLPNLFVTASTRSGHRHPSRIPRFHRGPLRPISSLHAVQHPRHFA
jgi:hypothetical protein